jgi:AcrR family transcriptional regulator
MTEAHPRGLKEEEKPAGNREVIFKAALRLFTAKGYDATTTNDICEAAGISKPTLYYYAKSKRHLFYLLHMEMIERDLKPHLDRVSAMDNPLERLKCMIEGYEEIMCLRPELRVLIHETLAIRDNYFEEVRQMWKKHYYLLRDTISELQERGLVRNRAKPSRLALLLLGMLTWTTFWFDYDREDEIREIASTALDLALRGLCITDDLSGDPRGHAVTPHKEAS